MNAESNSATSSKRALGVAIAIALPTLVTWVYFVLLADNTTLQKVAFAAKVFQFAFPLVWLVYVLKEQIRDGGLEFILQRKQLEQPLASTKKFSRGTSIAFGVAMGVAVAVLMWTIYQMLPESMLDGLIVKAREKVAGLGFASPALFIGLGVFYSLVHSFLEEYYFRWFVFGQLRQLTNFTWSMALSGLAFMAHHIIILVIYFGWTPMAAFLSISIAIGGMIWAWQYEKSKSLIGPWISHMIVDAGIFIIGYDLLNKAGAFAISA